MEVAVAYSNQVRMILTRMTKTRNSFIFLNSLQIMLQIQKGSADRLGFRAEVKNNIKMSVERLKHHCADCTDRHRDEEFCGEGHGHFGFIIPVNILRN